LLIQGETGVTASTGTAGHPAKCGVSLADLGAGVYALAAICNALYQREKSGVGSSIRVSMFDVLIEWVTPLLLEYEETGKVPPPGGTHHATIGPYGSYSCLDGTVINIAVQSDAQWARLCRDVFGDEVLLQEPRFRTSALRSENRKALEEAVGYRIGRLPMSVLADRLDRCGLPWGQLRAIPEVARHPQLTGRDRWRTVRLGNGGPSVRIPRSPFDTGVDVDPVAVVPSMAALAERSGRVVRSGRQLDD
jgi:crotonobetainyl-CoA:carnitine CoA-transferase CaiB-like acyl-CoA transferase